VYLVFVKVGFSPIGIEGEVKEYLECDFISMLCWCK